MKAQKYDSKGFAFVWIWNKMDIYVSIFWCATYRASNLDNLITQRFFNYNDYQQYYHTKLQDISPSTRPSPPNYKYWGTNVVWELNDESLLPSINNYWIPVLSFLPPSFPQNPFCLFFCLLDHTLSYAFPRSS